ncbi:MAG: hypothetical protein EPO63_09410 [Candidatus Nitrosotenuis sp.]|nr:MAG: hypothetical protein EPO63_09410 [Candidatus Nitrosotenuis sp.]
MKYLLLSLFLVGFFTSVSFATAGYPDDAHYAVNESKQTNFDKIEFIDGKPFFVSEKYNTKQGTSETINFHGIKFAYPSYPEIPDPGGFASTTVIFEDGAKKSISVGFGPKPMPVLAERKGVSAGMMRDSNGLHFLVSADLSKMSPLKQFKSGIPAEQVQCKDGLQLVFKYTNDTSVCVTYSTGIKLIERGWGTCVGHEDYHRGTPCGFSSSTDGG